MSSQPSPRQEHTPLSPEPISGITQHISDVSINNDSQAAVGIFYGPVNIGSSQNLNRVLNSLPTAKDAPFSTRKREHEQTCLPGTRTDLLRDIYNWVDGESPQSIFWLSGMAGTGKSAIAQTVAATYSAKEALGASFFFSRGGGDVGHAEKFVTSVAFQLANTVPALKLKICDAISKRSDIATQSLRDQWHDLVLDPLSNLDGKDCQSRYVLVIDALDECEDQQDIQIILQLLAEVRLLKIVQLRVFLTSRPEVQIRYDFKQIHKDEHQDFVLHEIEQSIVDHDISVFLREKLGLIRRKYQLHADWPEERAITVLVQNSHGLFIWAATACRFIEQGGELAERRLSLLIRPANSALEPERKLDEIYTTVLTNSIQGEYDGEETRELRKLFRQVVGPIIISQEPLSVSSLAKLLGKDVETLKRTLSNLHSVLHVPESELSIVRLLHPSFRDFLLDQGRCLDPQFCIDEKLVHREMYTNCLQVMSQQLRRDICNLRRPGAYTTELSRSEVDRHIQPPVQYACRFWVYHYNQSDVDIDGYCNVEKFLRIHFLHWLEALALLGCASDAVVMVHILDSGFLNKRNGRLQKPTRLRGKLKSIFAFSDAPEIERLSENPEEAARSSLQALIHDAVHFVLTFQPVLEVAPLQIYSAGLIFAPNTSIIRKNFSDNIPDWVSYVSGVLENWSPHLQTLKGHSKWVSAVDFSPDGKTLASASWDGTVKLWDAGSGKPLQTLKGHSDRVNAVAFSPNGKTLASASSDRTVKLWDAGSGKPLQTLKGHSDWVNVVAFSPNGKTLASASSDRTVKLWDAGSGKPLQTLKGHSNSVNAVAFSPDGKTLASASMDGTVKPWDAGSGKPLQTLRVTSVAYSLSFTDDGSSLLTDHGLLPIGPSSGLAPSHPSSPQSILVEEQWVLQNGERLLWLPSEYRPDRVTVHGGRVGFGYLSGRVFVMEFTI